MPALLRAAALTHFADVARACKLNPQGLLRDVGLPAHCLDDPDLKVPARQVGQLLERAALMGHEPAFALRMVESRRLSNLGVLGMLVRDEPTLRAALEAIVRYVHVHNEALAVSLEQQGKVLIIRQDLTVEGSGSLRQASELALGVMHQGMAKMLGARWQAKQVCFTHRAPASLTLHRRVFGDVLVFDHDFDGIVCDAASLDSPNPTADPVLLNYAKKLLEQQGDSAAPTLTDTHTGSTHKTLRQIRQMIVQLLPSGRCSVEQVASQLGTTRRTVARHLAAHGTTFSDLVDEVRSDLVERYLHDSDRPLSDVAVLLGFAAPSGFSRWYRGRFGEAARVVRWGSQKAH